MNTLYKYFVIVILFQLTIGQDLSNDDIVVSKDDLQHIAESLINIGDFDNAIAIYQEILNYQINTLGLNHIDVANTSDLIGELFVQTYRLDEAEIYFNQSLNIKSKLLSKNSNLEPWTFFTGKYSGSRGFISIDVISYPISEMYFA